MELTCNYQNQRFVASFDVDAQRTFTPTCPNELPVEGGDRIGPELNRQAQLAGWRLGSKDSHSPEAVWVTDDPDKIGQPGVEGENVEEHWPVHAVPGTEGFELVPELPRPAGFEVILNLAATRGIADESVENALQTMREAGIRTIESLDELVPAA